MNSSKAFINIIKITQKHVVQSTKIIFAFAMIFIIKETKLSSSLVAMILLCISFDDLGIRIRFKPTEQRLFLANSNRHN